MAISKIIFFISISVLAFPIGAYNVVHFGARGDGRTDSTASFLRAWKAACSSSRPSSVYVPRGIFLLKTASFNGPCTSNRIQFQIDGTLVAPHHHFALGNSGFWIMFYKVSGLSIHGGTIDARGARYWSCRKHDGNCPAAPQVKYVMFLITSNKLSLVYVKYIYYKKNAN